MVTKLILQLPDWVSSGCVSSAPGTEGMPTIQCVETTILRALGMVGTLALAIFLIISLVSGLRYITSGGDPKAVQKAQDGLRNGILGIVLIIGAWLALRLIETFTGVHVTNFSFNLP